MSRAPRLLGVLSAVLAVAPLQALDCNDLLRMNGMLRRAQAQCSFERFNPDIVDAARRCYDRLGPSAGAPSMRAGAGEFDRMASSRGEAAACALIGSRFSMLVR